MATITISNSFFKNEIRNYANWQSAFWRELLQNSNDAGATQIDIKTSDLGGGTAVIKFADNGSGMSRSVLENVFFNLGSTTKNTSSTVGGFGKARVILCFAQTDFQIRTGNLLISGSGAQYDIAEQASVYRGCEFTITVPYSDFYSSYYGFVQALKDYLSLCQMSTIITINGDKWKTWAYRRTIARTLTFGAVHVNKSAQRVNRMLVRCNGALMFEKYIHAPVQLIVEIEPEMARRVLLSNRDSLATVYAEELDKFCQEVASDTTSALKTQTSTKQVLAGGARKYKAKPKATKAKAKVEPEMIVQPDLVPSANRIGTLTVEQETESLPLAADHKYDLIANAQWANQIMQHVANGTHYAIKPNLSAYGSHSEPTPARDSITDGMIILNKATDPIIRKAAKAFHPDSWTGSNGTKRKTLLKQWIIACEWALDAYCEWSGLTGVDWRPGFVFEEDVNAVCQKQNDDSVALMLNPVLTKEENGKSAGTIKYQLRDWNSHVELLVLACHEVAHIAHQWHDEGFANLQTTLTKMAFGNFQKIHKEMMA